MRRRPITALVPIVALGVAATASAAAPGFVEPDVDLLRSHIRPPATNFGWVGAALGDLDGDDVPEYAVTAITAGGGGRGEASVYSGVDGSLLHTVAGGPGEFLGWSMDDAGDVDGDGVGDYVVGAPGIPQLVPGVPGRVLVVSGADHSTIHEITSTAATRLGTAVAGVGDLDGDGHDDVVVGAELAAGGAGRISLISGATGTTVWEHDGDHAGDLLGSAADGLGDVDGDGVGDVVVGAYGANGRGLAQVLSGVDGSVLHTLRPRGDANVFSRFFTRATPDLDGDGVADVFVADYAAGRGGQYGAKVDPHSGMPPQNPGTPVAGTGAAYVFSGASGHLLHAIDGIAGGEGFGPGRAIDDVDGDGVADLLIAAYQSDAGAEDAGAARILSGADASILRTITSSTAFEYLGVDALGIGDVTGDGTVDYLLTGFGSAHVVAG